METEASNILFVRYLLGDLPEEEQARLEDRAFSDHDYRQNILEAENDLIDEYVRGELSATARHQFEQRFLASAERQRKVEFARALAQVTSAKTVAQAAHPATATTQNHWWESFLAFLGSLNPTFQVSLAAAILLLAVALPWLVVQTIRLRAQVAQLQAQQQPSAQTEELRQQLAEQQRRNQELASQLQNEQQQLAHLQDELATAPTIRPVIASLFLVPGLSRGDAQNRQLLIPRGAQQARLQIGLERGDDYKRYRAELHTLDGREVVRQNNLGARTGRAGREVVLLLPASTLATGEYELALHGITDGGQVEDLGFYYFSVLRK